jgi:hypothetical protein
MRSRKLALSCTSRIRALALTDHSECVRHAARHGHPVLGADDQLFVAVPSACRVIMKKSGYPFLVNAVRLFLRTRMRKVNRVI